MTGFNDIIQVGDYQMTNIVLYKKVHPNITVHSISGLRNADHGRDGAKVALIPGAIINHIPVYIFTTYQNSRSQTVHGTHSGTTVLTVNHRKLSCRDRHKITLQRSPSVRWELFWNANYQVSQYWKIGVIHHLPNI